MITGLLEKLEVKEARQLSPLQLAYVGDAVYELFIRHYIMSKKNISVHALHKESINYVKAKAQKDTLFKIKERLTEEEWNTVKRGRNAKSGNDIRRRLKSFRRWSNDENKFKSKIDKPHRSTRETNSTSS